MSEISTVTVTNDHLSVWGAKVVDYKYEGKAVDFQDLMVRVTEQRASAIENEIPPLSKRMEARNKKLKEYGDALSDLSAAQAGFKSDDSGDLDMSTWLKDATGKTMESLGYSPTHYAKESDRPSGKEDRPGFYCVDGNSPDSRYSADKKKIEGMVQKLKTQIDLLNNASSEDMTRLQGLVDRRDQSYSTATSLMQAIGDTRSSLIKNM